ncbi:hypothetical protein [Pseudocolwellia agarivorans]|uniref:hypothetical protein n=1 Tax=Pseudocolwellia agarivorans TaxID=1911682 RepID=UPI003F885B2F
MKKFVIFTACLYLVSCGDYHVSNYLYEQYCSDKDLVGQFIFEQEGLTDKFFKEIPTDEIALRRVAGSHYLQDKRYLINENALRQHYKIVHSEKKLLSPIGPVHSFESYILRMSDGKKLGKAVTIRNKRGWLYETSLLWTNNGIICPRYKSERGSYITNEDSVTLIQKIFYKIED